MVEEAQVEGRLTLEEWRELMREGEEFTLPSGLPVRLRRVSLVDLAERGKVPAPLVGMVNNLVSTERMTVKVEEFEKYAEVVNVVVRACMVAPPVGEEASEDHLGIRELPMTDRLAVFNWANQVTSRLTKFRPATG